MALTRDDAAQIKDIVNAAIAPLAGDVKAVNAKIDAKIDALERVFVEKLNGHVGEVERLANDVDKIGSLHRDTEGKLTALTLRVVELEGTVKQNAAVAAVQEEGNEKKDAAVATVKNGISAMNAVWIAAGSSLVGAVLSGLVTFWLSGSGGPHP